MKVHYLACTAQSWSCTNHHISGALGAVMAAGFALVIIATGIWQALVRRYGAPQTPRRPADISPFTAGVLGSAGERGYKPRGITAVTPSGVSVAVRCPHRCGHRTPDLAVACGNREKARIEATGR